MTWKPGDGAVRHASNRRPASSGDSQLPSIRGPVGRSKQDRMRTQTASRPYRRAYSAATASPAALEAP